jgi:hypothetical protein
MHASPTRRRPAWIAFALSVAACLASTRTSAQPAARSSSQADELAAEALFEEGRALLSAGRYEEACRKLAASQRAAPAAGTLLNWGDCLERSGKTASAWLRFREATALAATTGQSQRERVARARAEALSSRLCKTSLEITDASPDIRVTRDGAVVDVDAWSTAIPLDPGVHELSVSAPGRTTWSTRFTIGPEPCRDTAIVRVPPLVTSTRSARDGASDRDTERRGGWRAPHIAAAGALGGGVLALAIGGVLAFDARSRYVDARDSCEPVCDAQAASQSRSALREADAASVFVTVGVASTILAGILWLASPRL